MEEGNLPQPQCPQCNMMVPWHTLNRKHLATAQCAKGGEKNCIRLAEDNLREISERAFQAYGGQLETVTAFKYLGRVMTTRDDNWPAVAGNLRKSWKSCTRMTRILGQEGADPRISGLFFKAVIQAVLLFGSDTWVLNPRTERSLGSCQHSVA